MRETHAFGTKKWVSGDYWRECDICGFDYLRSQLKRNYKNLLVCRNDWEPEPRDWKPMKIRRERPIKIE
jgi:hypothetical protein